MGVGVLIDLVDAEDSGPILHCSHNLMISSSSYPGEHFTSLHAGAYAHISVRISVWPSLSSVRTHVCIRVYATESTPTH